MKNNSFARFARAFFIFFLTFRRRSRSFHDVKWPIWQLTFWTTWAYHDKFSIVFLPLRRWFQFNSRIVRTQFASVMILNNWKNDCSNAKLHFQVTFLLSSTSSLLKFSVYETTATHQIRSMIGWMRKNERAAPFLALFSDLVCQTNDLQVPNLRFGRQRNQESENRSFESSERTLQLFLTKWPTRNNHKTFKLLRRNILRATLSMQQQLYPDTGRYEADRGVT